MVLIFYEVYMKAVCNEKAQELKEIKGVDAYDSFRRNDLSGWSRDRT